MNKKHVALIDSIVDSLISRIINGEYPVGAKLSENKVSEEFNCSRTPVREAFKKLEIYNIVEIIPHSGTYVRDLSDKENKEVTEIRAALESLAFRLACERGADTTVLRTIQEQMETILAAKDIDFTSYGKVHILFHRHLVELSVNTLLLKTYNNLNLSVARKLLYAKMNPDEIKLTNKEHSKIIEYLENGNVEEGERFMYDHLWLKRNRLLEK